VDGSQIHKVLTPGWYQGFFAGGIGLQSGYLYWRKAWAQVFIDGVQPLERFISILTIGRFTPSSLSLSGYGVDARAFGLLSRALPADSLAVRQQAGHWKSASERRGKLKYQIVLRGSIWQ
jgi:hypothetical protein